MNAPRTSRPEWLPYRVVFHPPRPNWIGPDCQELQTVYHVAHVRDACRILEDREIRAGLIGDESRLKETRTTVAWISANTWTTGSIYGNVQFSFSWDELLTNKRIFWVEAMTSYNPSAYRFLITDANSSNLRKVTEYDPESDEGPLRLQNGKWYWNGSFTSEFMVDGNIDLRRCHDITFIRHHPNICRLSGSNCLDRNRRCESTGAQVLSLVMSTNLRYVRKLFSSDERRTSSDGLDYIVRDSLEFLLEDLSENGKFGGPLKRTESRAAALRGALCLYGHGLKADAQSICNLFGSFGELKLSLEKIAAEYLSLESVSIPTWSDH